MVFKTQLQTKIRHKVEFVSKNDNKQCWSYALVWRHGLPDSIQPLHRAGPAEALGLLLDQQLGIVVCHHAGFANQSLVLQLTACDLLVQTLQAHQEHAVAKPTRQISIVV